MNNAVEQSFIVSELACLAAAQIGERIVLATQ